MSADPGGLLFRTIGCGEITPADGDARREVVLTGWVHRRRDLGRLIFVELRDATGRVQVVFDPDQPDLHALAEKLHAEDVVGVSGTVVRREAPNPQHPTGLVEVRASRMTIHNPAETLPFSVDEETEANEELRLTHRFVDLRRPRLQRSIRLRHKLAAAPRSTRRVSSRSRPRCSRARRPRGRGTISCRAASTPDASTRSRSRLSSSSSS